LSKIPLLWQSKAPVLQTKARYIYEDILKIICWMKRSILPIPTAAGFRYDYVKHNELAIINISQCPKHHKEKDKIKKNWNHKE